MASSEVSFVLCGLFAGICFKSNKMQSQSKRLNFKLDLRTFWVYLPNLIFELCHKLTDDFESTRSRNDVLPFAFRHIYTYIKNHRAQPMLLKT